MKNLGLLSIAVSWAGLIFLIRRWKGAKHMTFSQHAAQYKSSALYYAVLWSICLPLMAIYLFGWFTPTFHMGTGFRVLCGLAIFAMAVAAYVPETTGKRVVIHRWSAFGMALLFLPITVSIAVGGFSLPTQVVAGLASLFMTWEIIILLRKKRAHPSMLPLQAAYIAALHLALVSATYLR